MSIPQHFADTKQVLTTIIITEQFGINQILATNGV